MRRIRRGFTLIELLVVVAIIAILASLLLPALSAAVALYYSDYEGLYAPHHNWNGWGSGKAHESTERRCPTR